jgi:hypothetical protein
MDKIAQSADAVWFTRVDEAYKKSRIDGLKETSEFFEKERDIIENVRRAGGSKKIQIVWTLNKKGNTGECFFGELCSGLGSKVSIEDPGCPVKSQITTYETLQKWLNSHGFVRYPTNLCAAFGLNLECYAEPYAFSKEHRGRNNVIATYLTCEPRTGLARNTIIGRAVFVRKDSDGNPVSLTVTELRRAIAYINDLMDAYSDGPIDNYPEFCRIVKDAYPFYSPYRTHNMRGHGFEACGEPFEDEYYTIKRGASPGLPRQVSFDFM